MNITVPIYPRTSNHTDFDALQLHPHIHCQLIKDSDDFSGADIIILPGSKNVQEDLQWLKDKGWDTIIQRHLRLGGKVIGICGGYQMLGKWIHDPEAIESTIGSSQGLGLLEMETTLLDNKTLRNVSGTFGEQLIPVSGYEIHAGISQGESTKKPLFQLQIQSLETSLKEPAENIFNDGAKNNNGTVMGSYLHGLFDSPEFLQHLFKWTNLSNSDINENIQFDYAAFKNEQMNRLADTVETVLPLHTLCELLGIAVPDHTTPKTKGDFSHD